MKKVYTPPNKRFTQIEIALHTNEIVCLACHKRESLDRSPNESLEVCAQFAQRHKACRGRK